MRPDVKLGIVSSMMIILVAGGYYFYRDSNDEAIPVSSDTITTGRIIAPGKRVTSAPIQPKAKTKSKRIVAATHRPSAAKSTPLKAHRSAGRLGTKKPIVNPRLANKNAGRKSHPVQHERGKIASPVGNKTTRASRPVVRKEVATQKRLPGNRVAMNQSKRKTAHHVAMRTQSKRAAGKTPVKQVDEAVERHRVQPGDTMASLAVNYYGDEKYTQFLIDHNTQLANPLQLRIGTRVLIPSRPANPTLLAATHRPNPLASKASPKTRATKKAQARTYTVKSGDSFYSIARDELGDAAKWQKLFELNKTLVKGDARKLQIGQVIKLPS